MRLPSVLSAAAAVFALAVTAAVTPVTAQIAAGSRLTFTGTADATDLGTPGVLLDFRPTVVAEAAGNTGTFASLNRRSGVGVTGSIADLIVGRGPQAISGFLRLGGYRFDLQGLPSGPFGQGQCYVAPVPGQTCTPYQSALGDPRPTDPLSPFYLANVPSGDQGGITAVVAFNLFGTVTGPGGATSTFFGTIASMFPGLSYQEVLGGLEGAGMEQQPLPGITFTGTFFAGGRAFRADAFDADLAEVAVTPEPGTVALVAAGLAGVAGLGGLARRRRA